MEGAAMSEVNLYHGECLEVMKSIPDASVDLVLADLPTAQHSAPGMC